MDTRRKLALAGSIVPVLFLVRAISKYAAIEEDQAVSDAAFHRAVEKQEARQAEAGVQGVGRDTSACVEWAMAGCDPGEASCDACSDALRGCLSTCKKNEAYCATVPPYRATMAPEAEAASMKWQKDQRTKYGLGTHFSCFALFKFVELHCHPIN